MESAPEKLLLSTSYLCYLNKDLNLLNRCHFVTFLPLINLNNTIE